MAKMPFNPQRWNHTPAEARRLARLFRIDTVIFGALAFAAMLIGAALAVPAAAPPTLALTATALFFNNARAKQTAYAAGYEHGRADSLYPHLDDAA